MNFYRLEYQNDPLYIGNTYPQSQNVDNHLHVDSPNHVRNVWGKFPDDIYVPDSILHSKSKITDLISSSPIRHPIISDKLKEIICKYRNKGLEFVPTHLIVKGKKTPYWIMHGYHMDYQYIDFEQSNLISIGIGQKKIKDLNIQSEIELRTAIEQMTTTERIWIDKLVLKNKMIDDLFFLDRVDGSNYYVSENLKNEIECAGCTGIKFVEYSKSYP